MRNLKRALSLGLTAAMISGLMVMGAGAVSYPDSDQIQNQTAVEILGEIGVMVGDDNGNFNPTQDVTRAEMAVIITRILYGNDLNVDQFKGMNLFTDVPAWAEGFVNLCASLDIVAGVGDGKFAPNETVTAAQAALMLSRALGYFQNNAEFGNDWALAAIRRATSAGIIGDDMVLAANEGLSRDNVAQMTFNTLTKAVPVQYNELLNVYYNENQGITYALTFNYLQTLGYTNFDLVYDNGDTTIYGRPATTWGIGSYRTNTTDKDSGTRYDGQLDANGGLIASNVQILSRDEIITIENEPTYVYTDATDEEDIYDDLGATICDEDEYDWTVYVNGEEIDDDDAAPGRNVSADYAYTGKGAQTEIYVDDADKTVTVVEINYYLGQIAHVDEENGTVAIREVSDLSDDNGAELDDNDFATTEFADDDYVVYTIDQNADGDFYICEMMAPETVDGTVTRVQNNASSDNAYIYLNEETKYNYSGKGHVAYDLNDEGKARHPSTNTDYTLYLDPNGYVLAFSNEVTQRFLYVEDSHDDLGWSINATLDDGTSVTRTDIDSSLDNDNNVAGVLGHEDEVRYLTVSEANDKFSNPGADRDYSWLDDGELPASANRNFEISNIDYEIFEFETNSDGDEYTLSWRETKYAEGVNILNGENYMEYADYDSRRVSDVTINDNTIFVNMEDGVVYTGRDEVPDVVNAEIAYVVEDDHTRDVAEIVYILDGNYRDADRIFFVITDADRETVEYDNDLYFEFDNTYVDGRPYEDLYISYDALIDQPTVDIESLKGYDDDEYEDDNKSVSTEIENELAGKVIEVLDSDNGYATEIRVHYEWAAPIVADDSALDLSWALLNPEADNRNPVGYNTSADTIYVEIYEEYNSNTNPTRVTGYDVDVCDVDDIVEWTDNDPDVNRDGRATLVNVVKDDDGEAQLVYVYNFDPDFYWRDGVVMLDGQVVKTLENVVPWETEVDIAAPELTSKASAGYNLFYAVEGTDVGDKINLNAPAGVDPWDVTIPAGREDFVINVTYTHKDIAINGNLTLNTMDDDDAIGAESIVLDNALGSAGRIRYGFQIDMSAIPAGEEITSITWEETIVDNGVRGNTERKIAYAADIQNGNVVYETAVGYYSASDTVTVYVSNATVNGTTPVAEGVEIFFDAEQDFRDNTIYLGLYGKASLTPDQIKAYLEQELGYRNAMMDDKTQEWSFSSNSVNYTNVSVVMTQVFKVGFTSDYAVESVDATLTDADGNVYAWEGSQIEVTLGDNAEQNADWSVVNVGHIKTDNTGISATGISNQSTKSITVTLNVTDLTDDTTVDLFLG